MLRPLAAVGGGAAWLQGVRLRAPEHGGGRGGVTETIMGSAPSKAKNQDPSLILMAFPNGQNMAKAIVENQGTHIQDGHDSDRMDIEF